MKARYVSLSVDLSFANCWRRHVAAASTERVRTPTQSRTSRQQKGSIEVSSSETAFGDEPWEDNIRTVPYVTYHVDCST